MTWRIFLNKIVTGNETWVLYINAETKQQSIVWRHTASPNKPKKAWQTLSARKVIATLFWDAKEILFVEFMNIERPSILKSVVRL